MNNAAAFKFVQDLAKELSSGKVELPGFPTVFARVCRALDDPKNSNEQTARIVGAEPALAARLLTLANSVTYTYTGKPISELRSAVTRLGGNSIRAAASAFAVSQIKRQASLVSIRAVLEVLWKRSTYVAAICHVIGQQSKVNADEALLTGLLHGIGSLYLLVRSVSHPALMAEAMALHDLTLEWNAPISKSILENWSFPDDIVRAAGDQDDLERKHTGGPDLADVLICAKTLVECALNRACIESKYGHIPAFSKVGLTVDQYVSVVQQARLQIAAMQEALKA
jgi:HD-like signal output (HDOD) protein